MTSESIEIPRERIGPVAASVASSAKTAAGILAAVFLLFVAAGVGVLYNGTASLHHPISDPPTTAAGIGFWALIVLLLFARRIRVANRATEAGKLAASDASVRWTLTGRQLYPTIADVPRFDRALKLSPSLREMLIAVPRANVVS